MKKTSIKDLALALNLSRSAVSAALRRRPNISIETQNRVLKMAEQMGYSTDARISQLMSYLRDGKGSRDAPNLAWIYWGKTSTDMEITPWLSNYVIGAKDRAEALGYALDTIWIESPQFPLQTLNSVFHARGIEGLILFNPHWPSRFQETIHWSKFALASLEGGTTGDPGLPRVGALGMQNLQVVFDNVLRLGYQRPGLVISEWVNSSNGWQWSAGFLQQQRRLPEPNRIPILENEGWPSLLGDWMHLHRPDVIICVHNETIASIRNLGYGVPEDVAVVHLNLSSAEKDWAGINELHEKIGAASVDVVAAQLSRGDKGLSPHPKTIYIRGVWMDGWTCPPRNANNAAGCVPEVKSRAKK